VPLYVEDFARIVRARARHAGRDGAITFDSWQQINGIRDEVDCR
jgi:hypothetical protein